MTHRCACPLPLGVSLLVIAAGVSVVSVLQFGTVLRSLGEKDDPPRLLDEPGATPTSSRNANSEWCSVECGSDASTRAVRAYLTSVGRSAGCHFQGGTSGCV
jgi:hypothetical protein